MPHREPQRTARTATKNSAAIFRAASRQLLFSLFRANRSAISSSDWLPACMETGADKCCSNIYSTVQKVNPPFGRTYIQKLHQTGRMNLFRRNLPYANNQYERSGASRNDGTQRISSPLLSCWRISATVRSRVCSMCTLARSALEVVRTL